MVCVVVLIWSCGRMCWRFCVFVGWLVVRENCCYWFVLILVCCGWRCVVFWWGCWVLLLGVCFCCWVWWWLFWVCFYRFCCWWFLFLFGWMVCVNCVLGCWGDCCCWGWCLDWVWCWWSLVFCLVVVWLFRLCIFCWLVLIWWDWLLLWVCIGWSVGGCLLFLCWRCDWCVCKGFVGVVCK